MQYFSQRNGQNQQSFEEQKKIFVAIFESYKDLGYRCTLFGYSISYQGEFGIEERDCEPIIKNINAYITRKTYKSNLRPISDLRVQSYSQEDLFDMVEFLYSKIVVKDDMHMIHQEDRYRGDAEATIEAQTNFRDEINELLKNIGEGYVLEQNGEIHSLGKNGIDDIFDIKIPNDFIEEQDKINHAVSLFRKRGSTRHDKISAISALGAIYEAYRKGAEAFALTKKDDGALFTILNDFGIRHNNAKQNTDYNLHFLNRLFYFYLAGIHALMRINNDTKNP